MEVILKKDISGVGKKYETVSVSDGYARNYLIPRDLAENTASAHATGLMQKREHTQQKQEQKSAARSDAAARLDGQSVTIHSRANDAGKLFKRIRAADIAHAIGDAHTDVIETNDIQLESPIQYTGTHEVPVDVDGEQTTITVHVEHAA